MKKRKRSENGWPRAPPNHRAPPAIGLTTAVAARAGEDASDAAAEDGGDDEDNEAPTTDIIIQVHDTRLRARKSRGAHRKRPRHGKSRGAHRKRPRSGKSRGADFKRGPPRKDVITPVFALLPHRKQESTFEDRGSPWSWSGLGQTGGGEFDQLGNINVSKARQQGCVVGRAGAYTE